MAFHFALPLELFNLMYSLCLSVSLSFSHSCRVVHTRHRNERMERGEFHYSFFSRSFMMSLSEMSHPLSQRWRKLIKIHNGQWRCFKLKWRMKYFSNLCCGWWIEEFPLDWRCSISTNQPLISHSHTHVRVLAFNLHFVQQSKTLCGEACRESVSLSASQLLQPYTSPHSHQ